MTEQQQNQPGVPSAQGLQTLWIIWVAFIMSAFMLAGIALYVTLSDPSGGNPNPMILAVLLLMAVPETAVAFFLQRAQMHFQPLTLVRLAIGNSLIIFGFVGLFLNRDIYGYATFGILFAWAMVLHFLFRPSRKALDAYVGRQIERELERIEAGE